MVANNVGNDVGRVNAGITVLAIGQRFGERAGFVRLAALCPIILQRDYGRPNEIGHMILDQLDAFPVAIEQRDQEARPASAIIKRQVARPRGQPSQDTRRSPVDRREELRF